jgi:hypothetical protein
MGVNSLLILRAPELNDRMRAFTTRLVRDEAFRNLYSTDPARVILKTVFPDQPVPAAEVNRGNRLLYALLSNQQFTSWAQQYSDQLVQRATDATQISDPDDAVRAYLAITDRADIHRDIAMEVARTADAELIAGLTWRPDAEPLGVTRVADVAVEIETFIYAVVAAAAFGFIVAAVFLGAVRDENAGITRRDVQQVVTQLTESLRDRGNELRTSGALTDFSRRNSGYIR